MDIEQVRDDFISNALLLPPVDYFDNDSSNSETAAKSFLARVDSVLSAKGMEPRDFYKFLKRLMDISGSSFSFAFFGSAVYGKPFGIPNDIDLIKFLLGPNIADNEIWNKIPDPWKLNFMHIIKKYQDPTIAHDPLKQGVNIFLQSILLYPKRQNSFVKKLMKEMWVDSTDRFFDGGIGDVITLAVYSIVNCHELDYFKAEDAKRILGEKIYIPTSTMDGPIHPHEFCAGIRQKIKSMDSADLTKLTLAALRRIRVRQDSQDKLARKFLRKLY